MRGPPVDRDEFDRWRAEADAALRGARLQAEGGLHNWACFAASGAGRGGLSGLPGTHDADSDSSEALADADRVLDHVDAVWERLSQ
jgi:HEPN domain-containing protein